MHSSLLCAALAAATLAYGGKQALASPGDPPDAGVPAEPVEPELPAEPAPPEPVELPDDLRYRADFIRYDTASRLVKLTGNVVLEKGKGRLYAPRGSLDRAAGTLRLEGGVLAIEGLQVAVSDAAIVDLHTSNADLIRATMFIKDRSAGIGARLDALADPQAARTTGKNGLVLHGKSVRKLADGGLEAREVTLTPCDCAGPPDYEVLSPEVEIKGDRALMKRPWLHIFELPVPVYLPISLPVVDRASGMLAPRFGIALTTGFGIAEPVFLTLGRSWDVTAAPGWYTGASRAADPNGAALGQRTVRGPRLDLELRGAPVVGTTVLVGLNLVKDLDQDESPGTDSSPDFVGNRAGRGLGGLRGVLHASERSETRYGVFALDSNLATDAMAVSDNPAAAVLERAVDALRTEAGLWRSAGPLTAGLDATILQDVRVFDGQHPDRRLFGREARRTLERLPAAFVQLAPTPLAGEVLFSAEASLVRYQPLRGPDSLERHSGFGPTDVNFSQVPADPTVTDPQGLARASLVRLDVAPRLSTTLLQGQAGAVVATAGLRADAWLFDYDGQRNRRRAYATLDLRAETELSRNFGALLHTVAPSVEVKALSRHLAGGGQPVGDPTDPGGSFYGKAAPESAQQGVYPVRNDPAVFIAGVPAARRPYDDIDGAAPSGGAVQAVLRVDQSLWTAGAPGRAPTKIAELKLGQDVVLYNGGGRARAGETSAGAGWRMGLLYAGVRAQYDWSLRAFTGLSAEASAADARGDSVRASVLAFNPSPSELVRAGADELFSSARQLRQLGTGLLGVANLGASVRLPFDRPPLALSYSLDKILQVPAGLPDNVHHAAASIETPCRCAGLLLALDLPFVGTKPQGWSLRFLLDLKSLGAFGTP